MSVTNGSFETDTVADPGIPNGWTLSSVHTGEVVAGYDDSSGLTRDLPREEFEGGWDSNQDFLFEFMYPINPSELTTAFYDQDQPDPETKEDFEEGWVGAAFFFTWSAAESAVFDSSPEAVEDFEEEWNANESFSFAFTSGTLAQYDGTENVEDFEEVNTEQAFTVSGNSIVAASHGLSDLDIVRFRNEGGQLPGGISSGFDYYVRNSTSGNFQISTTSGGSTVTISDTGVGTNYLIPPGTKFWIQTMSTI